MQLITTNRYYLPPRSQLGRTHSEILSHEQRVHSVSCSTYRKKHLAPEESSVHSSQAIIWNSIPKTRPSPAGLSGAAGLSGYQNMTPFTKKRQQSTTINQQ